MLKRALAFGIAGILAIAMGIYVLLDTQRQEEVCTLDVEAVVVDYEEREDYDSNTETWDTVYLPILTYTVNGTAYTETYSQSYSERSFDVGSTVTIHCNPDAPAEYVIDGDNRGKVIPAWMIPVGAVLLIFAVGDVLQRRRFAGR